MKRLIPALPVIMILVFACNGQQASKGTAAPDSMSSASAPVPLKDTAMAAVPPEGDTTGMEDAYIDCYMTIADTGTDYSLLRQKMLLLSAGTGLAIDTLGRYYDAGKQRIILPENSDDEIYAGEYYPRRGTDEAFLSLEYLNAYSDKSGANTIALVSGIFTNRAAADTALARIRPETSGAFVLKGRLYMGCMH